MIAREPSLDAAPVRVVVPEILGLWLGTLLLIRLCVFLVEQAGLSQLILAAVPILFMYTPVLACRLRGVDSWAYPLHIPAFDDREAWYGAFSVVGATIAVVIVPWVIVYHLWQTLLFHHSFQGTLPADAWMLVPYHVFFVAIPEEFFYRGYMQSRLDELWRPRWRILGADLGPAWLVTCALFAAGHSVVMFQWWHFAIFFPALVFGWMRARTGGVIAGALFHAWCNVAVTMLDSLYGVVHP